MAETGIVFDEPLLHGGLSRNARCNRKVLGLSSLLIGLGCVFLLEQRNGTEVPHLKIESPGLSMVAQIPQLAGTRRGVQPIMSSLAMRSAKVLPFMQPSKTLLPMQSPVGSHSKAFTVQAVRLRGGPTVRFGDQWSDEGQEAGSEGTPGTGKVTRWNADRGFGFIQPDDGGEDLFVHVNSLAEGDGSVDRGDFVTFVKEFNDRQGKYEAGDVRVDTTKEKPVLETEEGVIVKWNDERGFGFIRPDKGGGEVFCHATALPQGESPAASDKVSFVNEYNEITGKSAASNVKIIEKGNGVVPGEGPGADAVEMKGQITSWNSERGFGFVKPDDEEEEVFVHVTGLDGGEGSVKEGDLVSFLKGLDERRGQTKAFTVKYLGEGPPLNQGWNEEGEEGEEGQEQYEDSQEGAVSGDRPEEVETVAESSEKPAKASRPGKKPKELVR